MRRLPFAVRVLGSRLIGHIPVRIRSGPNIGFKWTLVSSGRGYRTGRFETERVGAITALARPGDCFWDVGAHKGYITMAAARAVGNSGQVLAFEPARLNVTALERHVRWNRLGNVRLVPVALSDADGEGLCGGPGSSLTYKLGRGDERVSIRSIHSLIERDHLPLPSVLKVDTEGNEAAVLRGGLDCLSAGMLVWVAVHSRALFHECHELLRSRDFRVFQSRTMRARTENTEMSWGGDKELLAVGASRAVSDDEVLALPLFRG